MGERLLNHCQASSGTGSVHRRIDGDTPQALGRVEGPILERSDRLAERSVMIIEIGVGPGV